MWSSKMSQNLQILILKYSQTKRNVSFVFYCFDKQMTYPMFIGYINILWCFFFFFQLICVGTFAIAVSFFSVYDMAVDTLFLCFCKYENSRLINEILTVSSLHPISLDVLESKSNKLSHFENGRDVTARLNMHAIALTMPILLCVFSH